MIQLYTPWRVLLVRKIFHPSTFEGDRTATTTPVSPPIPWLDTGYIMIKLVKWSFCNQITNNSKKVIISIAAKLQRESLTSWCFGSLTYRDSNYVWLSTSRDGKAQGYLTWCCICSVACDACLLKLIHERTCVNPPCEYIH